MIAAYTPADRQSNEQVVRMPRPADALGSALREVFTPAAPSLDIAQLLHRLDDCA